MSASSDPPTSPLRQPQPQPAPPPPPPALTLTLIIRFATTALPDLPLLALDPATANAATICTLIRPHLPPPLSTCPLRLIYAGALLNPGQSLTLSLRLPSPPPPATATSPSSQQPPQQQQQRYIHCAISSETHLSAADLEREKATATQLLRQRQALSPSSPAAPTDSTSSHTQQQQDQQQQPQNQTDPEPRGFDRLASAGLSAAEIASLRSQFRAITAHTHTPDTMPTAAQMRVLEERWLDGGSAAGGGVDGDNHTAAGGAGAGAGAAEDEDGVAAGGLEDMLWGNLMGFFWAVGAAVWLVREPGVWSRRRQVGVVTGLVVNLAFCFLRAGG